MVDDKLSKRFGRATNQLKDGGCGFCMVPMSPLGTFVIGSIEFRTTRIQTP